MGITPQEPRSQVCPYLGCYWDRSMRTLKPEIDNRCFALPKQGWISRLLGSDRHHRRLDISMQEELCFADYRQCERYHPHPRR